METAIIQMPRTLQSSRWNGETKAMNGCFRMPRTRHLNTFNHLIVFLFLQPIARGVGGARGGERTNASDMINGTHLFPDFLVIVAGTVGRRGHHRRHGRRRRRGRRRNGQRQRMRQGRREGGGVMMVRGHIHRRGGDGRLREDGRGPPRRGIGLLPLLLLIVIDHVVAAIVLWFHYVGWAGRGGVVGEKRIDTIPFFFL